MLYYTITLLIHAVLYHILLTYCVAVYHTLLTCCTVPYTTYILYFFTVILTAMITQKNAFVQQTITCKIPLCLGGLDSEDKSTKTSAPSLHHPKPIKYKATREGFSVWRYSLYYFILSVYNKSTTDLTITALIECWVYLAILCFIFFFKLYHIF